MDHAALTASTTNNVAEPGGERAITRDAPASDIRDRLSIVSGKQQDEFIWAQFGVSCASEVLMWRLGLLATQGLCERGVLSTTDPTP